MTNNFDVIVVGLGSMGAAASWYLARRGCRVLGLEQFDITHEMGAHAGQSRIIRQSYFEHPDYVPLLQRAYENWNELEAQTGIQTLFPTGLLYAGRPEGVVLKGSLEAAQLHGLPFEELSRAQLERDYPMFKLPDDFVAYYEPIAGFVTPERAVAMFAEQAIKAGAELRARESVLSWENTSHGVSVKTSKGVYHAAKIIFTAGAWTSSLLSALAVPLTVTRQVVGWVNPFQNEPFQLGNFPCWMIEDPQKGIFYGFPMLPVGRFGGPLGLKIGHHFPGPPIEPSAPRQPVSAQEEAAFRHALSNYLPDANGPALSLKTCLYTYSPDEHFIIDFLPDQEHRVIVACGFSGHGFKFASVVGEVLAELAIDGNSTRPIDFLSLNRFFDH